MIDEKIKGVIAALESLKEDASVPRNVKVRIDNTISVLSEDAETSLKVNKALCEVEQIADDTNLQPYTRTQIWNVVSMLEML